MSAVVEWTPDLARLAVLMRGRLQSSSNDATTFTEDTFPSRDEAETALATICEDMAAELGPVNAGYWPALGGCASFGAAALLELGNFPEQTRTDLSPYQALQDRHDACMTRLRAIIAADTVPGDGDEDGVSASHLLPTGCFPCSSSAASVFDDRLVSPVFFDTPVEIDPLAVLPGSA